MTKGFGVVDETEGKQGEAIAGIQVANESAQTGADILKSA